jgi:hypothetical protein
LAGKQRRDDRGAGRDSRFGLVGDEVRIASLR